MGYQQPNGLAILVETSDGWIHSVPNTDGIRVHRTISAAVAYFLLQKWGYDPDALETSDLPEMAV